jgi:hypothetical protein
MQGRALIAAVTGLAALGACQARPAAPALGLLSLEAPGAETPLSASNGQARVLVFWRSDCAPCLLELRDSAGLRAAAGRARLMLVALEPAERARATLAAQAPAAAPGWAATQDAAVVLTTFGGAPPRLPLAVAVDSRGRLCGSHHGLLGTDRVREWARRCSG